jgi:hypothetical protein
MGPRARIQNNSTGASLVPQGDQPTLPPLPPIIQNTTESCMHGNKNFFIIDVGASNDAHKADLHYSLYIQCQEYSPDGRPLWVSITETGFNKLTVKRHEETGFKVAIKGDCLVPVRGQGTIHELMRAPCVVKSIRKNATIGFTKVVVEERYLDSWNLLYYSNYHALSLQRSRMNTAFPRRYL